MALEEYKRKRDFKITAEPGPVKRKSGKVLSYLIQKHDATRLHYDFRLELDGVLLSWAVTRGPSLDPADKRLAVRTEDHPISYGTFEGTIPAGQYGGGTVMLWDTGSWEPKGDPVAALEKGHLSFTLHGQRLKGGWGLIRMHGDGKRENWLLVKEKDEEAREDGSAATSLDDLAFSVVSKRKMEEIAQGDAIWQSNRKADDQLQAKGKSVKKKPEAGAVKAVKPGAALLALMEDYPEVQLATLVDKPPEGEQWLHEIKFDGYRLLGFVAGGAVRLRTRNGNDWTEKFPALVAALAALKLDNAVFDMEAVVLNQDGKTSFQALQAALSDNGNLGSIVAYVFDLLHLNGTSLVKLPLTERKQQLENILKQAQSKALLYSDHITGHGGEMIARSCTLGLEGIVSKQADAPYRTGRQKSWLKSKCALRQEFIILGMMKSRRGNRGLGALYLGYQKDGKLHYAGKVGTGFTMDSAASIMKQLAAVKSETPVLTKKQMTGLFSNEIINIQWAKPVLLCEVAFTEWTDDGHIRHPSFQGLREDKQAEDVTMEKPLPIKKAAAGAAASAPAKTAKPVKTKSADLVLHGITITHPDRVISEIGHVTKGDLAQYYAALAPYILKNLKEHPLSLLRCPGGMDGECFFQRNPGKGLGPDVYPFQFHHNGKVYEYLYIKDEKGLMEVVQMGAIELHPWGARFDKIDTPDRVIFDLDPAPDVPFAAVKLAALDLKARLENMGLTSFLKCTGGKGLHVTVKLAEKNTWDEVKAFAGNLAHQMVTDTPQVYVATMTKAKRSGKIFIDFFRNDYTATAVSDYGVRARPGAPAAVPLDWAELEGLTSGNQFSMADVVNRIKASPPDLARYQKGQRLPK